MGGSGSSQRELTVENNQTFLTSTSSSSSDQKKKSDSPKVNESELRKLESYYEEKIQNLEKQNAELYKATVAHFSEAVQQVEKKYLKTSLPLICGELQMDVQKCYQENGKQSLNCSAEVRAFEECIERQRQRLLAK